MVFSQCRELREFEIFMRELNTAEVDLISSITSMNIQKIIFRSASEFREFSMGHNYWTQLDDVLWRLADRPNYKLRLEVEFRHVWDGWSGGSSLEKHLPRFLEKGRLRVTNGEDTLIYCSDSAEGRK